MQFTPTECVANVNIAMFTCSSRQSISVGGFLRYASFDDKREVLEKIAKKQRGIGMAVNVLNYISKDTLERMRYEDAVLAEIDHQAEIDFAVKESVKKEQEKAKSEKLETARSLLGVLDAETIIQKFKLTAEEAEKLKEQII